MNKVDILVEGYAKINKDSWEASSTCILITTDSGKRILTDPGANRELLLKALESRSLTVNDIDFAFITHHHLDHSMLVGIFPNARVMDGEAIDWQALATETPKLIPDTDISIVITPGHTPTHAILLVPSKDGTVVVAGDNFWWSTQEEQKVDIEKNDEFASDMKEIVKSRKEVLSLADWIIPGHGKMFQNMQKNT